MAKLTEADARAQLAGLEGWELIGDEIVKQYAWSGFGEALAFANRVAALAEQVDHHPDILIQYNRVTLTLTSHDAQGLTERDFALARRIDA
jgi:4a-hydroxytetrahydrobiopterin dehydratase